MPRTVHLPEAVELAVRPEDALRTDEVDAADFEAVLREAEADVEDFGAGTLSADAGALRGFSTFAAVASSPFVDFEVTITSTRRLFSLDPSGRSGPKLTRPMCEPVTPLWSR
jgi:hypothetical protein